MDGQRVDRDADRATNGAVTGGVRTLLRLEGACVLAAAVLALGFGLKYATGFGATHLGTIGRGRSS